MRVKPWEDLDLETHWGWLDVRAKVVLDVGADYGSTADFFLSREAAGVIAVEGDPRQFRRLEALAKQRGSLTAVQKRIASVADWRDLLTTYTPQVVKADCEGGEYWLLDLDDKLFRQPEAWAVATINGGGATDGHVNVTHEPIPALGWPAMTMDLGVGPSVSPDALSAGRRLRIGLAKGEDGLYRIVAAEPEGS